MAAVNAVLAPSLYPSIFDPDSGNFLVAGTISWFGQDMVTPKNVWPTPDTTQSPYPNPYILDSIAAEPPMYYLTDEPYWIEIRQATPPGCSCSELDPIYSFFFYPNTQVPSSQTQQVNNFITNGQFQNPINFSTPEQESGVLEPSTAATVCPGWTVSSVGTDPITVFFEGIVLDDVASNPSNLLHVEYSGTESVTQIYQFVGPINTLQGENVTLLAEGNTVAGTTAVCDVIWSQYYGANADNIQTIVGQITLTAIPAVEPSVLSFQVPPLPLGGQPVDVINNYALIAIQGPSGVLTHFRITNIQLEQGTVAIPTYIEQPEDLVTARSIANAFQTPTNLFNQQNGFANYTKCTFVNNQYTWTAQTGTFSPVNVNAVPPDMLLCLGQSLNVQDYVNGIPLQRLFNIIGTEYGGVADIVASADNAVITAGSPVGARENSAWTAGTSGFTVTKTQLGLQLGISAALTTGSTTSVDCTFLNNFAPLQVYGAPSPYSSPNSVIGCEYNVSTPSGQFGSLAATSTVISAGSPSTQAIGRLAFTSNVISNYRTNHATGAGTGDGFATNFFEFASISNNFRGNYTGASQMTYSPMCILVSVDGSINNSLPAQGTQAQITVPFLSTYSVAQNVQTFINSVNNPFVYTITVGALPAASSYFLFSSSAANYYLWFTINGTGTDPAPGGTGILCALLSSDTPITAAQKIATAMQSATFSLPDQADLVALTNPNIQWAIYL